MPLLRRNSFHLNPLLRAGSVSILTLAIGCAAFVGCASSPKSPAVAAKKPFGNWFAQSKPRVPQQADSIEPGHGSFSTSDKPKNPGKVQLAYARWQEQMGQTAEARESYKSALEKNPKCVDALLGLARLDQQAKRYDEAEKHLRRAEQLAAKDPQVQLAVARLQIDREQWPQAIETLQKSHRQAPEDLTVNFLLGAALARNGSIREAIPYFSTAVGPAEAHYNVGYILYEQGDWEAAETQFQQALSERPDLAQARDMLAQLKATNTEPETRLASQHRPADAHAGSGPSRNRTPVRTGSWQTPVDEAQSPEVDAVSQGAPDWDDRTPRRSSKSLGAVSNLQTGPATETPDASWTARQREQWANQQRADQ